MRTKLLLGVLALVGLVPLASAHDCATSGTASVDAAHQVPICYWTPVAYGCVLTPHVCVNVPPIVRDVLDSLPGLLP